MGPTELCPGTHWAPRLEPTSSPVLTVAPAGTIFITDYPIFHRRAASHEPCNRDLLKYMYWRTSSPSRDWIGSDTPFDFARADYHSPHRHAIMGDCEQVVRVRLSTQSQQLSPTAMVVVNQDVDSYCALCRHVGFCGYVLSRFRKSCWARKAGLLPAQIAWMPRGERRDFRHL